MANRRVLGAYFSASDIKRINYYSKDADANDARGFQLPENSFRHAMRAPDQSPAEFYIKFDQFVQNEMKLSNDPSLSHDAQLMHFTYALHALQDMTSPSHFDLLSGTPIVWLGVRETGVIGLMRHLLKEFWDPGAGSYLDKITEFAALVKTSKITVPEGQMIPYALDYIGITGEKQGEFMLSASQLAIILSNSGIITRNPIAYSAYWGSFLNLVRNLPEGRVEDMDEFFREDFYNQMQAHARGFELSNYTWLLSNNGPVLNSKLDTIRLFLTCYNRMLEKGETFGLDALYHQILFLINDYEATMRQEEMRRYNAD